jgi:cytochrome c
LDEGVHGTGPSLFAIVDRDVAAIDGFSYSSGMTALEGSWTIDLLNAFLTKPKDVVAGTKMSFAGLKKDSDRANLIAYLQTTK